MAHKALKPTDYAAPLGVIDPDLNTAGDHSTAWISLAEFQSIMAIVMAGALGTNGTIDAKLEQATDAAGADAKDIDGAAIVQLTQAGSDSDTQAIIQVFAEDLDLMGNFTHVRLTMTVAGASCDSAGLILGFGARFMPASDSDAASVAQIVTV